MQITLMESVDARVGPAAIDGQAYVAVTMVLSRKLVPKDLGEGGD